MADEKKLKIVVFGAFGAGKTTLIKTIDPQSKHVEANCAGGTTTVALDFGRIQRDEYHIHMFGTPGQERFEFAREIISKGMDGAILLVDATSSPDDFTRHLHDSLSSARVPMVVFLNKCGNVGANPELLKKQFGTSPVWIVSALDREQSIEALSIFVQTLPPHVHNHP
jgi:small GTP-binding protein